MEKAIFRNGKLAKKNSEVTHISPQDPEATFFTIFKSLVSILDSKSSAWNGSDLSELPESESDHEPFFI
jgi:hypothetical protein